MTYFVIDTSADGDHYIEALTKEQLAGRLNNHDWGDDPKFLDGLPEFNMNYWGNSTLIIKGEIVVPKAKEKITIYEV